MDDRRSGRYKDATSDENVKVAHTLVMCDRRRVLRSIASEVGISFWAEEPLMSKVSARWAPQMLTDDQKKDSARLMERPWLIPS